MVTRISAIGILLFAAVLAYVVGTRIDKETISLLSGTAIGILVATPCASLITWILVKRRYDDDRRKLEPTRTSYHFNRGAVDPQNWVAPQVYPYPQGYQQGYPQLPPGDMWQQPRPQRQFRVIGGDEVSE